MDTDSAGESELSVALPPSLREWLDERADELDIEREALLVQLLETHRSAADLDEDGLISLFESATVEGTPDAALQGRLDEVVDDCLDARGVPQDLERRFDDADGRIDDLEAKLSNNVEDIRERVIQLRDAVEERAPEDHSHAEFDELSEHVDELTGELDALDERIDDLDASIEEVTDGIEATGNRIETAENKLDLLARVVVALKQRVESRFERADRLDEIRRAANRDGSEIASCENCTESVRIGLLSDPRCPHCDQQFGGFEASDAMIRWFGSPTLAVATDGSESESDHWQWGDPRREARDE
jgi:chromosome segregation ATPase